MSHEFPTADPEMWLEIMAKPLRYRQLTLWDWQLPKDDSLEVYRQNLKALGKTREARMRANATARHLARYGHEADWDAHGKCRECTRQRAAKLYRQSHGILLSAPLIPPDRTRMPRCHKDHAAPRDQWRSCIECRRDRQRRYVADEDRRERKREYDRQRYLARKERAA